MQGNHARSHDRPRRAQRAPLSSGAVLGLSLAVLAVSAAATEAGPALRTYQTRYYVLHTDLSPQAARAAAVRMTAMAEEYHRRTRGFSGAIRKKLPLYLFRRAADYHGAGGPQGSTGVFTGRKLLAVAGERPSRRTWHTLQHEGFHQFAHAVIRGHIPVWVNEGLAEYFGQAIFTGDGFVTGVVPPARLARLRQRIKADQARSFGRMMAMGRREWAGQISIADYDQAWSMVHFLVHGDGGRYTRALAGFIGDIGRGQRYEQAWLRHFGRDVEGFQARWRAYWLGLPADPTRHLYDKAVAATLTSFLARAASQRQRFAGFEEYLQAADAGRLKAHPEGWLPPKLLRDAVAQARRVGAWSIQTPPEGPPRLLCRTRRGTRLIGSFAVRDGRVAAVTVEMSRAGESESPPGPEGRAPARPEAVPQATGGAQPIGTRATPKPLAPRDGLR